MSALSLTGLGWTLIYLPVTTFPKRILGGKRRVGELFKDTVAYIRNIKKTEIHILIEENFLDMLNENGDIYKFKPNQVKS